MKVADLFAKIGFQTDEAPLKRLSASLNELKENIVSVGESVERVKHLMELALGFEVIRKLYDLSEHFAEWGQNLKVTATTIGVTTDELQRLSYAASQSGVSTEEMTHSLAHLARHIYDAKMGSKEAADAFYKAGISFQEVQGFTSAEQALGVLSDRIAAIKDPMQRLGMAQTLLGRGGYQMVAFLSKGSASIKALGTEAGKLGLVISQPQINNLEAMAHGFQRLHAFVREVGAYIASYFGPAIIMIIDKVIAFYNANRKLIDLELKTWLNRVAYTMGFVAGIAIRLAQWFLYLVKSIHDLYAALDRTPSWGRGLPPWAIAIRDFFESFGVGGKNGIRISDIFKGENADKLAAILDAVLEKVRTKVRNLFRNLFDASANESVMDALGRNVGDLLNTALITSGFAFSLGQQILDGMMQAIADHLPDLTGIDTTSVGNAAKSVAKKIFGEPPSGSPNNATGTGGVPSLSEGLWNILHHFFGSPPQGTPIGPASAAVGGGGSNNTYHFSTNLTVPPGSDGKTIAHEYHKTMQQLLDDADIRRRKAASQDQQAQASVIPGS